MRDILLIYNPKAGDASFRFSLDRFIEIFSVKNWEVLVFRSRAQGDVETYVAGCDLALTEAIFVAGGTGTINEVVNAMIRRGVRLPIGIIPAGTENEFARKLGFGKDLEANLQAVFKMMPISVDVGEANGRFFVDCLSSGTLNAMTNVSADAKNTFGPLAYYLAGLRNVNRMTRRKLEITDGKNTYRGYFSNFSIFNENVMYEPRRADGRFTLIAGRGTSFSSEPRNASQYRGRVGLIDENTVRLVDSHFQIRVIDDEPKPVRTALDGDTGPDLPLKVQIYPAALDFFYNPSPEKESKNPLRDKTT